jgi:hypothetical protein
MMTPKIKTRNKCVMRDPLAADLLTDPPPRLVFQALLAQNLMAFTEFAFSVVRPGISFKPNWHLEAVTEKSVVSSSLCPRERSNRYARR